MGNANANRPRRSPTATEQGAEPGWGDRNPVLGMDAGSRTGLVPAKTGTHSVYEFANPPERALELPTSRFVALCERGYCGYSFRPAMRSACNPPGMTAASRRDHQKEDGCRRRGQLNMSL